MTKSLRLRIARRGSWSGFGVTGSGCRFLGFEVSSWVGTAAAAVAARVLSAALGCRV